MIARSTLAALLIATGSAAGLAAADIVSISGGGVVLDNTDPDNADFPLPNQVQSSVVQGIDELQELVLGEDLTIDDIEDIIGVIDLPAGTAVSSHLLSFDPAGSGSVEDIEVVFTTDVVAVITTDRTLADTHATFGLPTLNYPNFRSLYGFEASTESFSVDGDAVTFSSSASSPGDYFRVLTRVPMACNDADFGRPFEVLDIGDVVVFLQLFGAQAESADLGAPHGVWDIADIVAFLQLLAAGCP
ncbi:MAG: hypothetical protein CMJ31_06930 [Phycisphaerae bacterium]|nr:hypothetical protein [Phycisphaerae bacterium]